MPNGVVSQDIATVGQLGDGSRRNYGGQFDGAQAGTMKTPDELDLQGRRDVFPNVLQAIARTYFDQAHSASRVFHGVYMSSQVRQVRQVLVMPAMIQNIYAYTEDIQENCQTQP